MSRGTDTPRLRFASMQKHLQFQVIGDKGVIFEREYLEPDERRLGALTGVAILEFQAEHPNISLLEEAVVLKWRTASPTKVKPNVRPCAFLFTCY